jgi:hypothetical protein
VTRRLYRAMPTCPYCLALARLEPVPPHGWRWRCERCDAHVGCHGVSTRPLGTLADAETRTARCRAHEAFDPLWRKYMARHHTTKGEARRAAYAWLSRVLHLPPERTHIAMFDRATCDRVIALCAPHHHGA